jgi:hypothetical protein
MKYPEVTSWRTLTPCAAARLHTKWDKNRQMYCNVMELLGVGHMRGGALIKEYKNLGDPWARLFGNSGWITNPFNQLRHNDSDDYVGGEILRGE